MVDHDVLARKIASATARLSEVAEIVAQPRDDFLEDPKARDLAAFYTLLAVQDCIDLASHWVADEGWQPPDHAGSTFDILADRGVVTHELATVLRQAVGLRNVIAHGYAALDAGRFYEEIRRAGPDIEQFLAELAEAAGL